MLKSLTTPNLKYSDKIKTNSLFNLNVTYSIQTLVMKYILLGILQLLVVGICQDINVSLQGTTNGITVSVNNGTRNKLVGIMGVGRDFSNETCFSTGVPCQVSDNITLTIKLNPYGYTVTWISKDVSDVLKDCYDLKIGEMNWFGGPQRSAQSWPIEKLTLNGSEPYVVKKSDNFAVAERYWLNSEGVYIFIEDKVPLFIDQNVEKVGQMCLIAKSVNPYINRNRVYFQYHVGVKDNAKEAHLHAVNNYLGKPLGYPNENMIREPIWTTWPKYKKFINETLVLEYATSVKNNNFTGQIEIDEDWQICFGSLKFKPDLFANIDKVVKDIKDQGFRVTLWIAPFVNDDCEDYSTVGKKNGYFVKNPNGDTKAIWWESDNAHQIDYTKPEAAKWYSDRVSSLKKSPGVDGFKFDAGETDYAIPPSQYDNVDQEEVPNILTKSYIETVSQFGDLIEVRSAWRTQSYSFFIRMIDKDSTWSIDDGLFSLVTTLLQMNMNGYGMVLPDMIGGNGYRAQPTAELIVRWLEANALMPAMQFGYLPWDYPGDVFNTTTIAKKFVDLHKTYTPEILNAMENSINIGTPVNPPIWWIDPEDPIALKTDDEFLLGENILVAPVLLEGARKRDIYLPSGSWKDGNSGNIIQGPIMITDYPVPIEVLPFFIRQ